MSGRTIRVLNVDDDEAGRYALSRILRTGGFAVTEAATGAEALRFVGTEEPDVIVLDVRLPDMSGFEVCRRIKAHPNTANIPVLYVSATSVLDADRARGLDSGGDGYLTEPVAPEVLLASVRSLTRMRHAEEALRLSSRMWEATFQAIPDGVALLDGEGRVLQHNQAIRRLLLEPPDLQARRLTELLPADCVAEVDAVISRTLAESARSSVEIEVGERRLQVTADPVPGSNNGSLRVVCILADVTERKLAETKMTSLTAELETQLQEMTRLHELNVSLASNLELRSTLEHIIHAVGALLGTPRVMIALYGPGRKAFQTVTSIGFASTCPPLGKSVCDAAVAEHRQILIEDMDSDPRFSAHREAARADGYRSLFVIPLFARSGAVIGCIATFFPAPRRLSSRESRLLDLYGLQAAEFIENAQLYEKIQEDDRRKDEFLAMLAHELRNPLSPILNAAQAMRSSQLEEEDRRHATEVLERQARSMARLIDDLMDVSRITRGKIDLQRETLDLRTVVQRAIETTAGVFAQRGHRLDLSLPPDALWVEGDPIRLEQVLDNLLNNAAKYTQSGGSVRIDLEKDGDQGVIRVTDSGVGIAPEMLPRVFDLFVQADRSLDRAQGGLGIGLTVVRSLVEMHGGSVEVASEGPGKGSEFRVRLPLATRPAGGEQGDARNAAPTPARRVLVVDDNADAATMLKLLLEMKGHEVRTAHDASTALAEAHQYRPDIMLLDIGLPGMNGFEVARRLRSQPDLTGLVLVALTGYGQENDRRLSREVGFDHHLVKPVDITALDAILAGKAGRG
jgi:PAS domain S-box-containing protein